MTKHTFITDNGDALDRIAYGTDDGVAYLTMDDLDRLEAGLQKPLRFQKHCSTCDDWVALDINGDRIQLCYVDLSTKHACKQFAQSLGLTAEFMEDGNDTAPDTQ